MEKNHLVKLISEMHIELNRVIEENNFDLQNKKVISYSQKLDKILYLYNKTAGIPNMFRKK